MNPERPRRRWLWLVSGLVISGLVVGLGWRAAGRREVARASVPARPELGAWPGEFADRIARGEAQARGWWRPVAGLTELSRLYHDQWFLHEALRCLAGLERLQSDEARWPHLQAVILAEFGRLDDARPAFERAVARAPDYAPARLRLGDVRLKTNLAAAAADAYAAVLARVPDEPFALLGLAKAALAGGDWGKARDRLEQAVRQHPEFVGGLSLLVTVRALRRQGRRRRAPVRHRQEGVHRAADPWRDQLADDGYDPLPAECRGLEGEFCGDTAAARRWLDGRSNSALRRRLIIGSWGRFFWSCVTTRRPGRGWRRPSNWSPGIRTRGRCWCFCCGHRRHGQRGPGAGGGVGALSGVGGVAPDLWPASRVAPVGTARPSPS